MNQRVTAYNTVNIEAYRRELEAKYQPSTFRFVRVRNFMDGLSEIFRLGGKSERISLYAQEDDARIDEKAIENDLAVVANDLIVSFKDYGKDSTVQGGKG